MRLLILLVLATTVFGQKLDPEKARALYRAMEGETVPVMRAAALAKDVNYIKEADDAVLAGKRAKALAVLATAGGSVLDPGTMVYVIQPGALWARVRAVKSGAVGWVMVNAFPKR